MFSIEVVTGTARAGQFPQPVDVPVTERRACSGKAMMPVAASEAVYKSAVEKFSASDEKARSVAQNWSGLIDGKPALMGETTYRDGRCMATFAVSTNDAAISIALTQDAFCNRPAAILTRVLVEGEEGQSAMLSSDAQQHLMDAFASREFAVIDVSEQTDIFREPIRQAATCSHTGERDGCEVKEHTLSETIIEILSNADLMMKSYDDENIRGEKYLPLAKGGVLNFVTISVSRARNQMAFTATTKSFRVSDRDAAWSVPPQRFSTRVRPPSTEEDILDDAFYRIAEEIAVESALRCTGQ